MVEYVVDRSVFQALASELFARHSEGMTSNFHRPATMAVLGPTNTGKTHYAIERMLGYQSGMIGFPLRLLARENYDRVVSKKGAGQVALVTGEEKIIPAHAKYFLCTVESMPLDKKVEFLAIDEIQMSADIERGHIFTHRLLSARGSEETLFLGAATIQPVLQKLIPNVGFINRPRLSKLSYVGPKKVTRLPRRTAIVAFSINEVYAIAELMRRQRGGTAVVLGALSPRTRNAQVSMYQSGEVDYLVATDAIGMGLNMNIDHVAFSGLRKFDGRKYRYLSTAEIAQIAGRAGRHMSDGTFGPIAEIGSFDEEVVTAIESHKFDSLTHLYWRNSDLDFRSARSLQNSLEILPVKPQLRRARDVNDQVALSYLMRDRDIVQRVSTPDAVRLLWDVCQIPDYRKTMADVHAGLLSRIFRELIDGDRLSLDWVATQITQLDRVDGDIDTLMARIAHVRTWTYISNHSNWLQDAEAWQAKTRNLEDKISDALHECLIQRFVDRRATALSRIHERKDLTALVGKSGDVSVGGEYIGQLEGFRFIPDKASATGTHRTLLSAANKGLRVEIDRRITSLASSPDSAFSIDSHYVLTWRASPVGVLAKGINIITPVVNVLTANDLSAAQRERIRQRLSSWITSQLDNYLAHLMCLRKARVDGIPRGIVYRLVENLGSFPRHSVFHELRALHREGRAALRECGIKIGSRTLFLPSLLKPGAVQWRSKLWALYNNMTVPTPPGPGLVTVPDSSDYPAGYLEACGYCRLGGRAIRVDVLDRVVRDLQRQSKLGRIEIGAQQLNLLGLSQANAHPIFIALGYRPVTGDGEVLWKWVGQPNKKHRAKRVRPAKSRKSHQIDESSPFSILQELDLR